MRLKYTIKMVLAVMIAAFALSSQSTQAQDIHFSQFYASPLTLNPAMTGLMQGCHRVAINYRNQYPQLYTYNDFAISYDASLMRGMLRNDFAGAGILFYNDRQGDGSLNNMQIMGSFAYHKAVDPNGQVLLSLGLQGGWVNKSVSVADLLFSTQQEGNGFNPMLPNQEAFESNQFNYFDLRAGGMISANINKFVGLFGGFSYFHIFEPEEMFLVLGGDIFEANVIDPRLVAHFGADIRPNNMVSISPNAIFMTQAGAREIVLGTNLGYHFQDSRSRGDDGTAVYLGASYRFGDNIIAIVGAEFNRLKMGISYDINVSSLNVASNGQGGIEMSVGYELGCTSQGRRGYPPVSCPRF